MKGYIFFDPMFKPLCKGNFLMEVKKNKNILGIVRNSWTMMTAILGSCEDSKNFAVCILKLRPWAEMN